MVMRLIKQANVVTSLVDADLVLRRKPDREQKATVRKKRKRKKRHNLSN